eukprot:gb/GEZN01007726.1/.p1 GENE.gb/GEZN01007726.1/~~gb/GEZN01007726.1/.p1  ORF type:complete len:380 (+),score=76.28 gb/GEZN01007726.1/:57-1196(+)
MLLRCGRRSLSFPSHLRFESRALPRMIVSSRALTSQAGEPESEQKQVKKNAEEEDPLRTAFLRLPMDLEHLDTEGANKGIWEYVKVTDEFLEKEDKEIHEKQAKEQMLEVQMENDQEEFDITDESFRKFVTPMLGGVEIPENMPLDEVVARMTDEQKKAAFKEYMQMIDAGEEFDDEKHVEAEMEAMFKEEIMPTTLTYHQPEYPLPYQDTHRSRSYPFEMTLETNIIRDEEEEHILIDEYDLIDYKSKLTVEIKDLSKFLSPLQLEIFKALVGPRYKKKSKTISFTSRSLPSMWGNENRVFQWFDALLWESKRLAEQFEKEGLEKYEKQHKAEIYLATVPKSHMRFNPFAEIPDTARTELEKEHKEREIRRKSIIESS